MTGEAEPTDSTDFGLRNSLEIGTFLRELATRQDFLTVDYGYGQIVTRLLHVDTDSKTFIFDHGALRPMNGAVLAAHKLRFGASPDGVRIEFTTGTPCEVSLDNAPAFEVALPKVLFRMQRREYFRVETPTVDPYFCSGKLPDGQPFRLDVYDLSLGGVALKTQDENIANLEVGLTLNNVLLHLKDHGSVSLDLQLVSPRPHPGGGKLFILGFRFLTLPAQTEKVLQQMIAQLEIKRGALLR
ncbi:flagellar brake protein [Paraburkholderia silviterrae]|uniref:Flagellar brake protein YcgR n=1 Tax=Paraburkholderia silviterrae TaxID=2528715 RepID=A0A4R5LXU7_9BURK|nr:flagellar brake protein [Paraburkholderia silviterrae]TDG16941.1 flagellar brake protein [Paraburkholderia silviterrae]